MHKGKELRFPFLFFTVDWLGLASKDRQASPSFGMCDCPKRTSLHHSAPPQTTTRLEKNKKIALVELSHVNRAKAPPSF